MNPISMISVIKLIGRFQQKRKKRKRVTTTSQGYNGREYLSGFILTKSYGAVTVLFQISLTLPLVVLMCSII